MSFVRLLRRLAHQNITKPSPSLDYLRPKTTLIEPSGGPSAVLTPTSRYPTGADVSCSPAHNPRPGPGPEPARRALPLSGLPSSRLLAELGVVAHKKKKRGRRRRGRRRSTRQRPAPAGAGSVETPHYGTNGDGGDGEVLYTSWALGRAGARAGRGFHFQDLVGAWLAARVAAGHIVADSLVPEGFEDMSLEGPNARHVQIKSRLPHRDRFPVGEATRHILDSWDKKPNRPDDGSTLVVVLEHGVKDEHGLGCFDRPLADALSADSGLRAEVVRVGHQRGLNHAEIATLLSSTAVVGVSWDEVEEETADLIGGLVDLPPSGLCLVARHLRTVVADASDANAKADYVDRCRLTKTDIVAAIHATADQVDVDSLESAVREGNCEALDFSVSAQPDDSFYEGVATQPHHVAAGLVVPRPDVMDQVLSGLDERSAVVVTGPSGVGKSAVLWTVPLARPGVLWYRVRRLTGEEAPALIRLARAYRARPEAPVGFLVDAAGTDALDGWDRLRAEAAAVPGVLLAASARSEDLISLGDLSGCATVTVRLDETAAETIFRGLVRRGATTSPHWKEAFRESDGLTLEFTHMLTRGRRLREVIGEQVRRRIVENRRLELKVLSLIAVADRWTASIATSDLAAACEVGDFELRKANCRLTDEHLIVERNGLVSGLHRLRSEAISNAIHHQPPPDLYSTVRRVLGVVPDTDLHRFVANLLRDEPSARDTVIGAACGEPLRLSRFAAYLHGLRLADFYEVAKAWAKIADKHQIPESARPTLFYYTSIGVPVPSLIPAEMRAVQEAMNTVPVAWSHNDLVSTVGEHTLARGLASVREVSEATELFAVLESGNRSLATTITQTLDHGSPLAAALRSVPVNQLSECVAAARSCHPTVADHLVSLIGGESAVLRRIRTHNPWLTELDIRAGEDGPVAFGRLLHVSDTVQDAQKEVVALGRLLLRCLPRIESVDIQALAPGGHELNIGNFTHGVSHLQRQYDYSVTDIAWNQTRIRAAVTLLGETDTTRLAKALPLLDQAAKLTHEVGTQRVTSKPHRLGSSELAEKIDELHESGRSLRPPLGTGQLGDTGISEQAPALTNDPLSALILALTGNIFQRLAAPDQYKRLAAYISATVIEKDLADAQDEPWVLLGIDGHPPSLDRLREALADIHAVVSELATNGSGIARVFKSARSGPPKDALHRAARTSRRQQQRRVRSRREALRRICNAAGLNTHLLNRQPHRGVVEFAVTVELGSLTLWPDAVERLAASLEAEQPGDEVYLLVPLREGSPVPSLSRQLTFSMLPRAELGDWAAMLPQPAPSTLADTFDEAQGALQVLSGIRHLPEDQRTHAEVRAAVDEAESRFKTAHRKLLEWPSDPLTDQLVAVVEALEEQVGAELRGEHTGASYAEQIAAGVFTDGQTDELHIITGARCLALEWEIDPEAAVSVLVGLS